MVPATRKVHVCRCRIATVAPINGDLGAAWSRSDRYGLSSSIDYGRAARCPHHGEDRHNYHERASDQFLHCDSFLAHFYDDKGGKLRRTMQEELILLVLILS